MDVASVRNPRLIIVLTPNLTTDRRRCADIPTIEGRLIHVAKAKWVAALEIVGSKKPLSYRPAP
jgi:hypothetical protein